MRLSRVPPRIRLSTASGDALRRSRAAASLAALIPLRRVEDFRAHAAHRRCSSFSANVLVNIKQYIYHEVRVEYHTWSHCDHRLLTLLRRSSARRRKSSERDSDLLLPAPAPVGILSRMTVVSNRIPQPGGTGNVGALRTLKAVQRASPVGPIGHRSMAASVRIVGSLFRRSTVRISPPVSVGLRTIETGGVSLAQRQTPRAFGRSRPPCKSQQTASAAARHRSRYRPQTPDPRPTQRRPYTGVMWTAALPCSVPLSFDSRAVERKRPSATGASSG